MWITDLFLALPQLPLLLLGDLFCSGISSKIWSARKAASSF